MSWQGNSAPSSSSQQHGGARSEAHENPLAEEEPFSAASSSGSNNTVYSHYAKYFVVSSNEEQQQHHHQDGATTSSGRCPPTAAHQEEEQGFIAMDETTLEGNEFEMASDVDVEKMDAWLKERSLDLETDDHKHAVDFEPYRVGTVDGTEDMDVHFFHPGEPRSAEDLCRKDGTDLKMTDGVDVPFDFVKVEPDLKMTDGVDVPFDFVKVEADDSVEADERHLLGSVDELAALGFKQMDKDNTLMTPQELESMPERGLEFEESVGPKERVSVGVGTAVAPDDDIDETVELSSSEATLDGDYETFLLAGPNGGFSASNVPISAVATISITTVKDSRKVTKIVINTQPTLKLNGKSNLASSLMNPIAVNNVILNQGKNGDQYLDVSNENIGDELLPTTTTIVLPVDQMAVDDVKDGESFGQEFCLAEDEVGEEISGTAENGISKKKCRSKVLTTHSRERPFKCTAEGCNWSFTTAYKLKRHAETHEGKKEFTCEVEGCNKTFTTVYNLKTHKKLHVRPNNISCRVHDCDMMFPTKRLMELHLKTHEGQEAPYKCPLDDCSKVYFTANSISTHMRVHSKGKLMCQIEGCGKVFDKPCRLKQHMRQHTGDKPYVCTHEGCDWRFVTASKLTRHMRKHNGDRRHVCPVENCGKSFMRAEHLAGHRVIHTGSKPFECPIGHCCAKFTAKSSLYVHMKKHNATSEKTVYACLVEACDKRYICKSGLRQHIQKFHTPLLADDSMDYVRLLSSNELQELTGIENNPDLDDSSITVSVPSVAVPVASIGSSVGDVMPMSPNDFITSNFSHDSSENVIAQLVVKQEPPSSVFVDGSIGLSCVKDPLASDEVVNNTAVISASLLQTNNSGSARTDYCSNRYLIGKRKRKDVHLLKEFDPVTDHVPSTIGISSEHTLMGKLAPSLAITQNDVVLTTTAITFSDPTSQVEFVQTQLLQDDPPSGDLYQDDNLLVPIAENQLTGELSVPIFLSEVAATDVPSPDVASIEVTEFSCASISLRDIE